MSLISNSERTVINQKKSQDSPIDRSSDEASPQPCCLKLRLARVRSADGRTFGLKKSINQECARSKRSDFGGFESSSPSLWDGHPLASHRETKRGVLLE